MIARRLSAVVGLAGLIAAVMAGPAGADTINYVKFYTGTTGYTGPYSAAGTVYDATKSLTTTCPTTPSGCGSGDRISDPMVFSTIGMTATADPGASLVWNDLSPSFGGLGVGTGTPSHSDQIGETDVLALTFASTVRLTGVGTLFATAHEGFGTGFGTSALVGASASTVEFLLSVDDGAFMSINFLLANTQLLSLEGNKFEFMQKSNNPTFYVSALSYESCGPNGGCAPPPGEVPLPAALPLFASGLAGLGLAGWRRKRRSV